MNSWLRAEETQLISRLSSMAPLVKQVPLLSHPEGHVGRLKLDHFCCQNTSAPLHQEYWELMEVPVQAGSSPPSPWAPCAFWSARTYLGALQRQLSKSVQTRGPSSLSFDWLETNGGSELGAASSCFMGIWDPGLRSASPSVSRRGAGFLFKPLPFLVCVSVLASSVGKEAMVGHQLMSRELVGSRPGQGPRMSSVFREPCLTSS